MIDRRSSTITLYPSAVESELADLFNETVDAQRQEVTAGAARFGTRSKALTKARAYDERLAEAKAAGGHDITLWAIDFLEWDDLTAQHPPRDDNEEDAAAGVNKKTFARALLHCSLVAPDEVNNLSDRLTQGSEILRELRPSRLHYVKLERAAWAVNVEDDALPKFSLASLLTRLRGDESEEPSAQE